MPRASLRVAASSAARVCIASIGLTVSCVRMCGTHLSVPFRRVSVYGVNADVHSSVELHLFLHLISYEQLLICQSQRTEVEVVAAC